MMIDFFLINLLALIFFVFVDIYILPLQGVARLSLFMLVLCTVLTALEVPLVGIGHVWNVASIIGKMAASVLAIGAPICISGFAIHIARKKGLPTWAQAVIALACGIPILMAKNILGIYFACIFTGDCL